MAICFSMANTNDLYKFIGLFELGLFDLLLFICPVVRFSGNAAFLFNVSIPSSLSMPRIAVATHAAAIIDGLTLTNDNSI